MGHLRYLAFYLICGVGASLAMVFTTILLYGLDSTEAQVPSLGASGAISGVLAGYLILFPGKRVLVILFRIVTWVPSIIPIGLWFLLQLISELGVLGGGDSGGVGYAAHIGGFVAGMILVKPFALGLTWDSFLPGPAAPREPGPTAPRDSDERW
jgi:membrane associated rhomboid family serine protease